LLGAGRRICGGGGVREHLLELLLIGELDWVHVTDAGDRLADSVRVDADRGSVPAHDHLDAEVNDPRGIAEYAGGGKAIHVTNLDTARRALTEIAEQGEGDMHTMYDDDGDLAHYYRFQQIKHNRAYLRSDDSDAPTGRPIGVDFDAVYPMLANPRSTDYSDPDLRAASDAFNRTWSELLRQLEVAFNGEPGELVPAVHSTFKLRDDCGNYASK